MCKPSRSWLTTGLLFVSISAWGQKVSPCDLNLDGRVDAADVQAAINMALGGAPCTAKLAGVNTCNLIVVQRVISASIGGACVTSLGLHVVLLSWTPSPSPNVTGYNVYRSTVPGGAYTLLQSAGLATNYMDTTVLSGQTYYYSVSAVDNNKAESPHSNPVQAVVTVP